MRVYLIRHGQSVNNALAAEGRDSERVEDPPLTEIGEAQAEHVASFLSAAQDAAGNYREPYRFTHLYCSAMLRALQTAQPISKAFDLLPEVWVDIHEVGGIWLGEMDDSRGLPGLNRSAMLEQFPGYVLPETITDSGWWTSDGREQIEDFLSRAVRVAVQLKQRSLREPDAQIALVSHAAFLDQLLKALLNIAPVHPSDRYFQHYNTAITRVDIHEEERQVRVEYVNRVDHLPEALRT